MLKMIHSFILFIANNKKKIVPKMVLGAMRLSSRRNCASRKEAVYLAEMLVASYQKDIWCHNSEYKAGVFTISITLAP
jgi:hypothetical protein